MASYDELRTVHDTAVGDPLKNRIYIAITIEAQALLDGTPTAGQLLWGQEALDDPQSKVSQILHYMISNNNTGPVASITGASDSVIQTNTNLAVTALVI